MTDAALDESLARLDRHKARWAQLPIRDKIQYLVEVRALAVRHADAWVAAGASLKGLPQDSPLIGAEEWLGGPYPTIAWLSDVMATLKAIDSGADPLSGYRVSTNADGQTGRMVQDRLRQELEQRRRHETMGNDQGSRQSRFL